MNAKPSRLERHHVLFTGASWEASPALVALRSDSRLIPKIDSEAHAELHQKLVYVPTLSNQLALRVLSLYDAYEPTGNPLHAISAFQHAIDKASQRKKVTPLERDVARLTLRALDMQKPFLG